MITTVLIIHGLLAVLLLAALSHQTFSVWWPAPNRDSFFASYRAVRAGAFTNSVVILYVVTAVIGGGLYPSYRLDVRVFLEHLHLNAANGIFELKEHFVAVGLGLLPAYWFFWQPSLPDDTVMTRKILTALLAFIVWWSFLVGHILNNIKGFGL